MSAMSLFDIAGRAMAAQMVRLNSSASNLANAGTVSADPQTAYRPLKPVFATVGDASRGAQTVDVVGVVRAAMTPERRHEPGHPLADAEGYVHVAPVDPAMEMVEMLETAQQYRHNLAVVETTKSLTLETLRMGR